MKIVFTGFLLATGLFANNFQLLYTSNTTLESGRTLHFLQSVIQPFSNKKPIHMGKQHKDKDLLGVESFYVVHKGIKKDLTKSLSLKTLKNGKDSQKAFYTKHRVKEMGDHLFVLEPQPMYSFLEKIYLQQFTKLIVNVAGKPTDWDAELGLPAEIVPLSKPYGIWEGSSFSGVVKASGIPVPFAEIEIEYLNSKINFSDLTVKKIPTKASQQSFKTIEIKANERGEFTFFLPKEGWWGFNAHGIGHKKEYKEKELSQDAIIWVQVKRVR